MEDRERALIVKTIMEEMDRLEDGIAELENDIREGDTDVTMAWQSFGELSGMEYMIKRISVYGLDCASKRELYDRTRQADEVRYRLFEELLKVTYK